MFDLNKHKIPVNCPACGRSNTAALSQVSRQETIRCGCGQNIQLVDSGGSNAKAIRDINSAMKNFERTLKKFGR